MSASHRIAALAASSAGLPWDEAADRPLLARGLVRVTTPPAGSLGRFTDVTEAGEDALADLRAEEAEAAAEPAWESEEEEQSRWETQRAAAAESAHAAWEGQ